MKAAAMKAEAQLGRLAWPEGRLLEALVAAAGGSAGAAVPVAAGALDDLADASGVEVDAVEIGWEELKRSLPRLGPAVLRLPAAGGLLVVPRGRGRGVALLTPDGRRRRVSAGQVTRALRRPAERGLAAGIEPLVDGLSLKARWRRRACAGLIAAHLGAGPGCIVYLVGGAGGGARASRLGAGRGPQGAEDGGSGRRPVEMGAGGLGLPAGALLAAVGAGQALFLGGWYLLGGGLVAGQLDRGRLLAWALLMLSLPLARMAELTAAATLGHRGVLLLRRRLAASVLALAPATVRGEGTGGLLGRLLAAESIERLLLTAVPGLLLAAAELAGAAVALAHGIAAAALLALLVAVLGVEGGLAWRYGGAQRRCAASRLDLTGRLVEGLSGHRTRLAQRGAGPDPLDDRELARFHAMARRMDDVAGLLRAALPRAWLCGGLAVMAVRFGHGGSATGVGETAGLAASLGGLLLAQSGLGRLAAAVCDLAAASTAGGELGLSFCSGRRRASRHRRGRRGRREPARLPWCWRLASWRTDPATARAHSSPAPQ